MKTADLNDAMQYIDDRYLDLADAPEKEIIRMTKRNTITRILLIAAAAALLAAAAYAADFLHVESLLSWTRTSYASFPEMENAMQEAGFRIDAKETFRSGYAFDGVYVKEVHGEDEHGEELLTYSTISVSYRNQDGKHLFLSAGPDLPEVPMADRPADRLQEIGSITASYYQDHYKWVPEDYEPTDADLQWEAQPGNFLSYGADEVSENAVTFLCWNKDGIRYSIMDIRGSEDPEVMFDMARELICP